MKKSRTVEEQPEPVRELIAYTRERDLLGKSNPSREHLIAALTTVGRSRKESERVIENARRRVRSAADQAEERLVSLLRDEALWSWTHPREAIREMRQREFGGYEDAPLTDIEQGLVEKGNVLWIIAVYPALKWAILSRLTMAAVARAPEGAGPSAPGPQESAETS